MALYDYAVLNYLKKRGDAVRSGQSLEDLTMEQRLELERTPEPVLPPVPQSAPRQQAPEERQSPLPGLPSLAGSIETPPVYTEPPREERAAPQITPPVVQLDEDAVDSLLAKRKPTPPVITPPVTDEQVDQELNKRLPPPEPRLVPPQQAPAPVLPKEAPPDTNQIVTDFLSKEEGKKLKSYPDAHGRSIGYGFFLDNKDSRDVLTRFGIEDFDAVYRGEKAISEADARKLMQYRVDEANRFIDRQLGSQSITPRQRAALVSLYYNGGPSLLGPRLLNAARNGNWGAVEQEIRQRSNKKKDPVLQRRREREASLLRDGSVPQIAGETKP